MEISKVDFPRKLGILFFPFVACFLATLLQNDLLSNIFCTVSLLTSAGTLLFAYLRADRRERISIVFLFYSLACFSWALGYATQSLISLRGGYPAEASGLIILYSLTYALLSVALLLFSFNQIRKWDFVQITVDIVINTFFSVLLFWIIFFNKDLSVLGKFLSTNTLGALTILTDLLIGIGIYSCFLSIRSGKVPFSMRLMSFGIVLFTYTSIAYYYLDFKGLDQASGVINFTVCLAFGLIAFGALWQTFTSTSPFILSFVTNTGSRSRWIYLLLYPLILLSLKLLGFVHVSLTASDLFAMIIPLFLYWAFCKYIQLSLEKEALLRASNEQLSQRVAEQVSELTFLANQDTLTTLFNRRHFMTCLDNSLTTLRKNDCLALVIIDLDRFKTINDTFGHDVGDKLLTELSRRLIVWNTFGATIARLGGDEFALLFVGKYTQKDIADYCSGLLSLSATPYVLADTSLSLTMSIGAVFSATEHSDGKTLLQNADIAMYRSKSQGYNKFLFYDSFMSEDMKRTTEIEVLLRQTDPDKDFELFYQPQYSLPDMKLIGAEALLRWKNAEHGYIPPNVFIPIAEQIDYIYKIGTWVMQETIRQSATWNKKYSQLLKVGFNISPKQFKDENFVALIRTLVTSSKINPAWIDAEITENVMMDNDTGIKEVLHSLKSYGITVSIDDFGAGYSSLGYLNRFPFDRIKIDKSLIDNVNAANISGTNVVKAAVNMAHASGIQTIAEGVETQEQLDLLVEIGCDQAQGYLLGRPVPADVFEERYIEDASYRAKIC